jgi:hypothetical protein
VVAKHSLTLNKKQTVFTPEIPTAGAFSVSKSKKLMFPNRLALIMKRLMNWVKKHTRERSKVMTPQI